MCKQYPWRARRSLDFEDPFTCLIATILSANSTDKVVNKVTPGLFSRASTPEEFLEEFTEEELYAVIRPVGLAPAKARNILLTCRKIVTEYEGLVPRTLAELTRLPGVGGKTARVVLCQALGQAYFPVDTHCRRLLTRWGLTTKRTPEAISQEMEALLPGDILDDFHLKLVWYGREYCQATPRHAREPCEICRRVGERNT